LIYNLLLDFPTATLGGEVDIPTIDGKSLKVKIDNGTQPGKTMRLRGRGLPAVQGYGTGRGDLLVNISVYVPKTLSREEKKAIESFKDSDNFKGDSQTRESIFQRFKNYFA
jgi:molecular chaperone DnaJ